MDGGTFIIRSAGNRLSDRSPVDATFFTVSDSAFFPGTVGVVNSLTLTNNSARIVVLDIGLRRDQRELLRSHADVVQVEERDRNPLLLKPFPHALDPTGVVVIIDSDILVTSPLDTILAQAADGRICATEAGFRGRWFAEWGDLLGLDAAPRRQSYVNSGFVAFSTSSWPNLLRRWWELCERIAAMGSTTKRLDHPLHHTDQDALNALLMTEVPAESLSVLRPEVCPQGYLLQNDVEVLDVDSLRCVCRGHRTLLMHSTAGPKPWKPEAWRRPWRWRPPFARILRRSLTGADVPVRISPRDVPLWLRPGAAGGAALTTMNLMSRAVSKARGVRSR